MKTLLKITLLTLVFSCKGQIIVWNTMDIAGALAVAAIFLIISIIYAYAYISDWWYAKKNLSNNGN